MHFFDFVVKNLLRRKVRTALTGLGVAVAVAAVVALLGVCEGFERESTDSYARRGVDLVVLRAGVMERLTSTLDVGLEQRFQQTPQVRMVTPSLSDVISLGEGILGVPVRGLKPGSFMFEDLKITSGRQLGAQDHFGAIVGSTLARDLKKKAGDPIQIELQDFRIEGIFESQNIVENGSVLVLLSTLQELMDRQGQVSEFHLGLHKANGDEASVKQLRSEIEAWQDPQGQKIGLAAIPTQEFVRGRAGSRLSKAMAQITSAVALIIGSVGLLNTMIMTVLDRVQEIGILRAIGWRKSRIIQMILCESFLISLGGAILGTLFAWLLVRGLTHFPAVAGYVSPNISPQVVLIGLSLSLLVGLIGGSYPAYHGASLPPTEALRHE